MPIRIYDSLTREKRDLVPLEPGLVRMYVCGPTVYDDAHIGHLMGPVLFDTIARWIATRGFEVRFLNNITDIDDKIIKRANATGEDWLSISRRYEEQYKSFLAQLHVTTITGHPRCTEFVPQMVTFIADLIESDRAYVAADGVYYDVKAQAGYGKLSGRRVDDMQSEAQVDPASGLRHGADFALWKFAKPGEPTWESPWGAGRPGWHLECSVMASELLGENFDLHGGGDDLKFPHHENEIAQSEAHGDDYASMWMHNGLVQYGGRKIAKSDPRNKDPEFSAQFKIQNLLDTHGAPTLRFFLLRGHYRRPIDFEPSNLQAARTGLQRIYKQLGTLLDEEACASLDEILGRDLPAELSKLAASFCAAMDDDFGTGEAIGLLFTIAQKARGMETESERESALRLMRDLGRLLGIFMAGDGQKTDSIAKGAGNEVLDKVMDLMLELRQESRERKDFALSDRIRDGLSARGIRLLDGKEGSSWELD